MFNLTPILGLLCWLFVSFVAAGIGGLASAKAADFYQRLNQPDWAPPAWVFGPVWTALYALMGIAAWLVWRRQGFAGGALYLFLAQLAVNALWSWIFFAWQHGGLALLDILVLWGLLVATIIAFWRQRPLAGALLLPYLAWVTYAAGLNFAIWRLNPQLLS